MHVQPLRNSLGLSCEKGQPGGGIALNFKGQGKCLSLGTIPWNGSGTSKY
jgi:hypothetical protein